MNKAVIYCRVSDPKQMLDGNGLKSQERLCREFAKTKGLVVERVFEEKGVSGGNDFRKRPAMTKLLQFLDEHPDQAYAVIFDDLKRFARNTWFHLMLRQELQQRKASLLCPNFKFENTPENEFIEIVLAAQGELELKQNKRQVNDKMRARLQAGMWVFALPLGYEYRKVKFQGKLVKKSKAAKVTAEALNGFAMKRFQTQRNVVEFLRSKGIKRSKDAVKNMLTNILYAGYLEYPRWGVPLVKAVHTPLISLDTFQTIQKRLEKPKLQKRKTDLGEFPLRRKLRCAICKKNMFGAHFRGKTKLHAHYTCQNAQCSAKPKYHKRKVVEEEFISRVLAPLVPTESAIECFKLVAKKVWNEKTKDQHILAKDRGNEIQALEKRMNQVVERTVQVSNPNLIRRLEAEVDKIDLEIKSLQQEQIQVALPDFDQILDAFLAFTRTPAQYWQKCSIRSKNALFEFIFSDRLEYCPIEGFRTPCFSFSYNVFRDFCTGESSMVQASQIKHEHLIELLNGAAGFLDVEEDTK